MGTRNLEEIIEEAAYLGFYRGILYVNPEMSEQKIKHLFIDTINRGCLPLESMQKKKTLDISLIGFLSAFECSDIPFYKQIAVFCDIMNLDLSENEKTALYRQATRLINWKNKL